MFQFLSFIGDVVLSLSKLLVRLSLKISVDIGYYWRCFIKNDNFQLYFDKLLPLFICELVQTSNIENISTRIKDPTLVKQKIPVAIFLSTTFRNNLIGFSIRNIDIFNKENDLECHWAIDWNIFIRKKASFMTISKSRTLIKCFQVWWNHKSSHERLLKSFDIL
jgi:hypothetical protein